MGPRRFRAKNTSPAKRNHGIECAVDARRTEFVTLHYRLRRSAAVLPGLDIFSVAGDAAPASPEALALADRAALSEEGRQIYAGATPAIEAAAEFRTNCIPDGSGEGALGCFDGRRIHLFGVYDPAWDGYMVSTAVHEMLHAAWQRLPGSERDRLSPFLVAASDADRTEPRVASVIDGEMRHYNASSVESPEMVNELHSILGTQVAGLPPELESYYARYFMDRMVIVALDASSSSTYDGIITRIDEQNSIADAQQIIIDQRRVATDEWTSSGVEADRLRALLDSTAG
jgi:hypothetical protein